jgi:hypothetical protein
MAEILASNLIRLLVTVAILAAVYLFAIKPILDTTNDTIDRAFEPFDGIQSEIKNSFDDAGINGFDVNDVNQAKAQLLLKCIKHAQPDTDKMQACANKFQN